MADGARDLELAARLSTENMIHDEWNDDDDDEILASILDQPCDNILSKTVSNNNNNGDNSISESYQNKEEPPLVNEMTPNNEESSTTEHTKEHTASIKTQNIEESSTSEEIQNKDNLSICGQSRRHETLTPQNFRPLYLCVSDLTKQHWCEQQLWYMFTVPTIQVEDPVITAGSTLHLARELAVHDVVPVETTSREDCWAIKLLNLLGAVQGFLNGVNLAREIPIFGAPFDQDIFLVGVIDELRFDPESYTIELSELKTRSVQSIPKKAQQEQNRLQVMIYKKLFDDLVKGQLKKEMLARHMKLQLDKPLGAGVLDQFDLKFTTARNLDELADYVFERMQALTCISELTVEYVHQKTSTSLMKIPVEHNEDELRGMFCSLVEFWRGNRKPKGVDIEEAWKCQRCDFADVCEWRERKAQEYANKNKTGT